jgi:SAM-dependent methyltransferase
VSTDFDAFKSAQRQMWTHFHRLEVHTTPPAAHLARVAGAGPGQRMLDVACGTGVVAVTAALKGAVVTGLDLTPALVEHARQNAALAGVSAEFVEGDAEALPFPDATFDVVTSQFGHMFAPRPLVAIGEMLRVLKPGGTLAFSTWPPEHFVGRLFDLTGRYLQAPPDVAAPSQWGDPNVIRQRLGDGVEDLRFERGVMQLAALSLGHYLDLMQQTGPMGRILQQSPPEVAARFTAEITALAAEYWHDNQVRQDYLVTRARRR